MKCGVLGDPIAHSLSPVLHRAGYEAIGLDWDYDAYRVGAGELASYVSGLGQQWRGLSLTMPLKREALGLLDASSDDVRRSGAANTLILGSGRIQGHNTDIPGAVAAIRERYDTPLTTAVILGGGATATSTGLALFELGVTEVRLAVRDVRRATQTVEALRRHPSGAEVTVTSLPGQQWSSGPDPAAQDATVDIVVSTIPVQAQTPEVVDACAEIPVVFDVLYDPWPTPLAASADDRVLVSGLDLLVHQAALQFELFTGEAAPLDAMRAAGEQVLAGRASS